MATSRRTRKCESPSAIFYGDAVPAWIFLTRLYCHCIDASGSDFSEHVVGEQLHEFRIESIDASNQLRMPCSCLKE
jgi:hypothetical protein